MAKKRCKRYYYVPSTYKGRKFKRKGKCGGAYRGCGRICGGSLDDLVPINVAQAMPAVAAAEPVDIPVEPAQVEENILGFPKITDEMIERARQVIALAEATGKVQPITKKEAGIWSGLKNLGSKVWSGVKKVASNPYVQTIGKAAIPMALGALMPYAPGAIQSVYKFGVDALNKGERRLYNHLDRKHNAEQYEYYGDDDQGMSYVNPETGKTVAEENGTETLGEKMADAVTPHNYINAVKTMGNNIQNVYNAGKNWLASHVPIRFSWRRASGYGGAYRAGAYRGCGRKGRLRKGSPEAKAYMAMLRRMRGKKKTSKKGGMFRGVTLAQIHNYYQQALKNPNQKVNVQWTDSSGRNRTTKVSKDSLEAMERGTDRIKNFYIYDENGNVRDDIATFRSDFLSTHHGKSHWPYKMMGERRERKHQKHLNSMNKNRSRDKILRFAKYWAKRANKDLAHYLIKKETGLDDKKVDKLIERYAPKKPKILSDLHPLTMKRKGRKKINKQQKAMLKNLFH